MADVQLTKAQAKTIAALADLFGPGSVRAHEKEILDWVWYRTELHDWCVTGEGEVQGWNDTQEQDVG